MKKSKMIIALVLVLSLTFALTGCGGGYSSAEDAAEALVEAYLNMDAKGVVDCYPEFALEELADDLDCDEDEIVETMEEFFEDREDESEDFEIKKVKVEEDGDDLDDLDESIEDAMSKDDKKAFEEWAEVSVKVKVDGETMTLDVLCFCFDGSWYAVMD